MGASALSWLTPLPEGVGASALSWAAVCQYQRINYGLTEEAEATRRKAIDLARQAVEVGENDPGILANAVFVLALLIYVIVRYNERVNPRPSRTTHNTLP